MVPETLISQPWWVLLLSSLSTLPFIKLLFSLLHLLYTNLLSPPKNLLQYGNWAIVTGPTDGIGKAIAIELSLRGLNLVLVGRNLRKLNQVSSEIHSKAPRLQTRIIVIDFSRDIRDGLQELEETTRDIDVDILVNNAGITNERPLFFNEMEEDLWERIVRVNMVGATMMAAAVLPGMMKRRRGVIFNIGSASITRPSFPLFSMYYSSKSYIRLFSKSLHHEYKQRGIHIQCEMPWFVLTNLTPMIRESFFVVTPMQYAPSAVNAIGYGSETTSYWMHLLQIYFQKLLPDWATNKILYGIVMEKRRKSQRDKKEHAALHYARMV